MTYKARSKLNNYHLEIQTKVKMFKKFSDYSETCFSNKKKILKESLPFKNKTFSKKRGIPNLLICSRYLKIPKA